MQLDISEATVPTLENLLVPNNVSYEGIDYATYSEEKIKGKDMCLGFNNGNGLSLFQITYKEEKDADRVREVLSSLDLKNEEVLKEFVSAGVSLIQDTKDGVKDMIDLEKGVEVGGKKFYITYMSPTVSIAGKSLHDNYQERVMRRIYS